MPFSLLEIVSVVVELESPGDRKYPGGHWVSPGQMTPKETCYSGLRYVHFPSLLVAGQA